MSPSVFSHGKLYVAVLKSHFKRWIEDINNRDGEREREREREREGCYRLVKMNRMIARLVYILTISILLFTKIPLTTFFFLKTRYPIQESTNPMGPISPPTCEGPV